MPSLERPTILNVAKASSVAFAAFLVYHSYGLYKRNNITVRITELVKLPPQGCVSNNAGHTDFIHNDPTIEVKGSIEVETYLMRSYRFLLKLSAQLNEMAMGGSMRIYGSKGDSSVCNRSFRRRVLSYATAYNNTNINTTGDTSGTNNLSSSTSVLSTMRSQHKSLSTQSSPKTNTNCFSRAHVKPRGPLIQIEHLNEMVDQSELLVNEHICFTPACLSEEILMRYAAMIPSSCLLSSQPVPSSVASDTADALNPPNVFPPCLSNIIVRNSFLRPDKSGGYCISLDLAVFRLLHELRLLIRLPNRHCRLVRADTGGVGRVALAEGGAKSHLLIWEIGSMEAHIQHNAKKVSMIGRGADVRALLPVASSLSGGGDLHNAPSLALLSVHFELVYRQLEEGDYGYYNNEAEENSNSDVSSSDNDFVSTSTSEGEANKTDLTGTQTDTTEKHFGGRRGTESVNSRQRGSQKGYFAPKPYPSGTPSPPNQSNKARKRQALALKKNQERQRRQAMNSPIGMGIASDHPTLEVTYSVTGLASGVSVRRLQVLDEKINWTPRSVLDRVLLRYILPDLQTLKLNKFAHYTTWFVQPIILTEWNT